MASILGTDADKAELERQIAMKLSGKKQTMATAREIVETQVLPESRARIEAAGFKIDDSHIRPVKALPEPAAKPIDEDKVRRDLAAMETIREDDPLDAQELYTPEVEDDASLVYARLGNLSDLDRFEKLIEFEVRGLLIPREHKAWMTYFEQTREYARHREYFDDHRNKMAVMYGPEAGAALGF
jgi:hypothetical protein